MFDRTSRYAGTPPYSTHPGTQPRSIRTLAGAIEHTLSADDRLDRLAAHYYGDPRKWWLILDANPEVGFGGDVDTGRLQGMVVVIPADPGGRR